MHELKQIRELTGLSQKNIADWLNVSRSLVLMVENGQRTLPNKANYKLVAMILKLKQVQETAKARKKNGFNNSVKLGDLHQKKMEKHRQLAKSLQAKLNKLQKTNPRLQSRMILFEMMKNHEGPGYTSSPADEKFIEMMEWFTQQKLPVSAIEEQELLQDKIDTHLAYADLHQEKWGMYAEMG